MDAALVFIVDLIGGNWDAMAQIAFILFTLVTVTLNRQCTGDKAVPAPFVNWPYCGESCKDGLPAGSGRVLIQRRQSGNERAEG